MQVHHAAIFAIAVGLAGPAVAADPSHGADLAKRWCAACHVVSEDQKQANADVPSFAAVARQPDFSAEKLAFFLLDPHPKMPNFPLTRIEAGDIAAYIASLRK
jgi:mono/diheme cytochrome c family protein